MKNEEKIIKKLLEHDERFSRIDEKLIAHDEKFDKMDEKFDNFRQEYLEGQEQMMTILKRLDEERIFTIEWVRRIELRAENQEKELEKQKKEINKIKVKLKIA